MQSVWWRNSEKQSLERLLALALALRDVTEGGDEAEMQEAASLCLSFADRVIRQHLERESEVAFNVQAAGVGDAAA